MSVITDCPYICAPNIMDTPGYTTKMVTLDMTGKSVIKAGTPISADGKVANDETAIGVLLNDCHACLGARRGLVVISGRVKQDVATEHSGVTISDEAKSALVNITFTGDGARGGGGGRKDFVITSSGTSLFDATATVTYPRTYNQLKADYGEDLQSKINVLLSIGGKIYTPYKVAHGSGRLMVFFIDDATNASTGTLSLYRYHFAVIGDSESSTVSRTVIG